MTMLEDDPRFAPAEAWENAPLADLDAFDPGDEANAPAPALDAAQEVDALLEANRHLRAVARLRHDQDTTSQVYDREISRIMERRDIRLGILQRQIDWLLAPVRQLHERLQEIDPKRKTLELPHGTLRMRVPSKPVVFVDDPDRLVLWARAAAPELLPPPDRIRVTDLRKVVEVHATDAGFNVTTADGEIVPHVHAEVPQASWSADTDGGDL